MIPQLDLSTYVSQVFWLLTCFVLLWISVSVFITPKIADVLEQRKRKINEYIKKADKLNTQAKETADKYTLTLEQAQKRAEQKAADERAALKDYLSDTENKMTEQLNKKIAGNEFTLAKEKKNTLLKMEDIAEDLAFEIVQKLGFFAISRKDIADIAQKDKLNG